VAERSVDEAQGQASTVASSRIRVTIRYFAAARAAAGVTEEQLSVPTQGDAHDGPGGRLRSEPLTTGHSVPAASTVGEVLDAAADRHGPSLARVLVRCSFLLNEVAVHGRQTPVLDGQVLDILPPFAGG
jgi:molybdopterin converting factor small subunit